MICRPEEWNVAGPFVYKLFYWFISTVETQIVWLHEEGDVHSCLFLVKTSSKYTRQHLNTKEDILKNEGNRAVFYSYWSQWCPKTAWLQTSSEYLPLCSERTHSYRFGNTWGWVNDDRTTWVINAIDFHWHADTRRSAGGNAHGQILLLLYRHKHSLTHSQ